MSRHGGWANPVDVSAVLGVTVSAFAVVFAPLNVGKIAGDFLIWAINRGAYDVNVYFRPGMTADAIDDDRTAGPILAKANGGQASLPLEDNLYRFWSIAAVTPSLNQTTLDMGITIPGMM